MVSNSDVIDSNETYSPSFIVEMLRWCYTNDDESIVVIWNKNNEIIYVSQLIEEYFQVRVEEIIGANWTLFLPDEQVEIINKHFESEHDTKLKVDNIIIRALNDDQFVFDGIFDIITIKEEFYYIGKLRNNTYKNELKQMLLNSEKLIQAGELSAGLVHEVRNPLTSLKGFLQLVQAGVQQKEEYYKVMIDEIEKLERITSELLHMAKPFKNTMQNECVLKMIDDVLFLMNTQTDMRDVHFLVETEEGLMTYCNASQIKQVLINLIKNGAESMGNKGNIAIKTRKEKDNVIIDIIDEGKGISDDLINRLDHPFFTTKQEGTGLGLVITQHILQIHKGELQINTDQTKGTTFTIILPSSSC